MWDGWRPSPRLEAGLSGLAAGRASFLALSFGLVAADGIMWNVGQREVIRGPRKLLSVARRHFLQTSSACLLVSAMPKAASAQLAGKIILEFIKNLPSAVLIAQYIEKWFQDKQCNVSVMDLKDVKFQCELILLALTDEVTGAIPTLTGFVDKKDAYTWNRAKRSLGVLLNDGRTLMETVSLVVSKLDPKTYPLSQEDIKNLNAGIEQIRPAIAQLAGLPDEPDSDTVQLAASVLKAVSILQPMAKDAILELQKAVNERQHVSCP